jgi:hypothetical protein
LYTHAMIAICGAREFSESAFSALLGLGEFI